MSQKLWVQHSKKSTFIDQVSIDGCESIADFLNSLYKRPLLGIPQKPMTLFQSDAITEIDVKDSPLMYLKVNSREAPLILKTTSIMKPVITRNIGVSCQKYLDSIALKLSTFYVFKEKYRGGATFGDILEAVTISVKPRWSHILETDTYEQEDENGDMVQINAGDLRFPIPLPSLFTDDEWDKLRILYKSTHPKHNRILPANANGKLHVVISHSDFNEELISLLQSVGVKSRLFSSPDDLEVEDDLFSTSVLV